MKYSSKYIKGRTLMAVNHAIIALLVAAILIFLGWYAHERRERFEDGADAAFKSRLTMLENDRDKAIVAGSGTGSEGPLGVANEVYSFVASYCT
jgi:hypothetical protein